MANKALTLALALAAGLLGSTLSRYMVPTVVFAEAQSTVPKEIRAQRFTLVDENGTVRGVFAVNPAPTKTFVIPSTPPGGSATPAPINDSSQKGGGDAVIVLYDASGREVYRAGAPAARLVGER